MSNKNVPEEAILTFDTIIRKKLTNPNDWIILSRLNCVDAICKSVIQERDREIIKAYFSNAEICYYAWQNGFRHKNIVHLISKGKRKTCTFCGATFSIDDLYAYRIHVLQKHIAKGKYGKYKEVQPMLVNQVVEIE